MMKVQLKVRKEAMIRSLDCDVTFKIPESSYLFMRLDVDGLTVQPRVDSKEEQQEVPPIIKVLIPGGKLPVVCLSTGRAQWMNAHEKVQIVELEAKEIFREEE